MYLTSLLTLVVESVQRTFNEDYPEIDFRDLWCSLEYPEERANYPGIWVGYSPTTNIQNAGLAHVEFTPPDGGGARRPYSRWRYAGQIQLTCVTLSSLERARLIDEVVKVVAFGRENVVRSEFIHFIETNDLIACQVMLDRIGVGTPNESPGTPWGTDEVLYEQTVVLDCQGEFISDGTDAALVPLSQIDTTPYRHEGDYPSGDGWV